MRILTYEQGTEEWKQARAGKVTGSRLNDVLAKIKTGEAASRRDYRAQLVAEILTGLPQDSTFVNEAMRWGTEHEAEARGVYEAMAGCMVDTVGLVLHPTIDRAAASPDGLVGDVGLLEIKCPNTATHLDYILADEVPAKYQPQMLWQMRCCERDWCEFMSYDPRLPEHLQVFVKRFDRDDARIAAIEAEVQRFLAEVDRDVERLMRRTA